MMSTGPGLSSPGCREVTSIADGTSVAVVVYGVVAAVPPVFVDSETGETRLAGMVSERLLREGHNEVTGLCRRGHLVSRRGCGRIAVFDCLASGREASQQSYEPAAAFMARTSDS
jgi:hypothetical protein